MKLYQYAILFNPSEKEKKEGKTSKILVPITSVLSPDDKTAAIQAARAIPEEYMEMLTQINITVRPF
jgi:hypothetical protein